eukprot:scaffold111826_cov58-Phaeocystis_antarctica.AAC.4
MVLLSLLAAASALVQFTPDQADWSTFQSKPLAASSITDPLMRSCVRLLLSLSAHDPDSIGWITAEAWAEAQWDGTVPNPNPNPNPNPSPNPNPDPNPGPNPNQAPCTARRNCRRPTSSAPYARVSTGSAASARSPMHHNPNFTLT